MFKTKPYYKEYFRPDMLIPVFVITTITGSLSIGFIQSMIISTSMWALFMLIVAFFTVKTFVLEEQFFIVEFPYSFKKDIIIDYNDITKITIKNQWGPERAEPPFIIFYSNQGYKKITYTHLDEDDYTELYSILAKKVGGEQIKVIPQHLW